MIGVKFVHTVVNSKVEDGFTVSHHNGLILEGVVVVGCCDCEGIVVDVNLAPSVSIEACAVSCKIALIKESSVSCGESGEVKDCVSANSLHNCLITKDKNLQNVLVKGDSAV